MKTKRSRLDRKIFYEFGIILRKKRKEKKLTQEQLADLAGIHRTYVAGIEGGYRNPSLKNILKLARAMKIKVQELFNTL